MPLEPYGSTVLARQANDSEIIKAITKFALVMDALIVRNREDSNP
jgi:hypothetical protein